MGQVAFNMRIGVDGHHVFFTDDKGHRTPVKVEQVFAPIRQGSMPVVMLDGVKHPVPHISAVPGSTGFFYTVSYDGDEVPLEDQS